MVSHTFINETLALIILFIVNHFHYVCVSKKSYQVCRRLRCELSRKHTIHIALSRLSRCHDELCIVWLLVTEGVVENQKQISVDLWSMLMISTLDCWWNKSESARLRVRFRIEG